ncbi:ribonuclease P protein component [Hyphomicrobium sp.]|uniref:ribonuclease P protein component n=1 Tax=Hyphomicrobium sp. TaxID=82 RepID=UPI002FDDC331
MAVETLKKRSEYLRLRGGARCATPSFVLETRARVVEAPAIAAGPRFGYTVTKKLGGAVVRNRIRRRLKAAVALVAPAHARAGHDYVLVGRALARERPFEDLKKDLERALHRVHHPATSAASGKTTKRADASARKRP